MKLFWVVLLSGLFATASVHAQSCVKEDSGWRAEALRNLTRHGLPLTENGLKNHETLRCIRMNNYVCMMHSSPRDPWNGSGGRHDCALGGNGHAVFSEAKYSIRAMVRDLCSKHRGRADRAPARSALAIVELRTPWCDTLGSVAERKGYGRTCAYGPTPSRRQWVGLERCEKPENGRSGNAQCAACNCPDRVARRLVRGIGLSSMDDLALFDAQGRPNTRRLKRVLSNIVADETGGMRPTDALLEEGIRLAGLCKPR